MFIDLIKGRTTPAEVARQHGLTVAEVETALKRFMAGGRELLRAAPRNAEARFEAERKELHAKIGDQALHIDLFKLTAHILSLHREAQRQGS